MKTRKSIIAMLWIAVAALAWSCNDDTDTVGPDLQNVVAESLLANSNSALDKLRSNGIGGPMGALFGNSQSARNGRSASSPTQMTRSAAGRTDTNSAGNENPACMTETWEDDGNGNYTYTLDFGDGCDFYGEHLKGKMVEKGSYSESGFSAVTTYTNFGGEDWTINGTQSYSGTWEEVATTTEPTDTAQYNYNASYEFGADLNIAYMEYGHDSTQEVSTGEQLIEVAYVGQGAEEVDQDGYTVKSRSETVSLSTGESFQSQVDTQLYYNFACEEEDTWIYVSGVESGTYTVGDQSGTYSIDYGSGACDNIITITENGTSQEVDLGEIWEEWEEECGES